MKTILLLRHAKSDWGDPGMADRDRPLNQRGQRAAVTMARHIAAKAPPPELILCSTATRTRQTLAALLEALSPQPPVSLEAGLYLAPAVTLLGRLGQLSSDVGTVLLIGHNDGIWELAAALAGRGKPTLQASLRQKYPTGSLAILNAPIDAWTDLRLGAAELAAFVRPRDLADE